MAGELPLYESTMRVPDGSRGTIQPIQAPAIDTSAIGAAVSKLGDAANSFAVKLAQGQAETDEANIKTEYLTELDKLRGAGVGSEDYRNAGKDFETGVGALQGRLLGGVMDDKRRAELRLYMQTHAISAGKEVSTKQLANEGDAYVAGLNERSADYVRRIAGAGSPEERQTAIDAWNTDLEKAADAGWITKRDAFTRRLQGMQTVDDAAVLSIIRVDPRQALLELQDPEKFKALGPVQRENLINQARGQVDQLATLEQQNIATRDPARAAATIGRVGGDVDGRAIFSRGIVAIESSNQADAVSPKGALGLSQIMPGTARDVARALGKTDIAALSDQDLKKRLLTDTQLNLELGGAYWNQMLNRYDGRVAVAAAAYNAGPGRADAWFAKAREKFGDYFTSADFASVVDIDESKKYIGKLYTALNADITGGGLSPRGQLHAASVVHAALQQQNTERVSAVRALATVADEQQHPAQIFQAGYNVDPATYATWKQRQLDAANTGDMAAAKRLREAEFQREMLPARQQAFRSAPAELEAYVGAEEARLAGAPNVTPDEKNRLDVAREVLKSVKSARDGNIIGLAEQAQFVPAHTRVRIDPAANPGDQAFQSGLALRGAQANSAAAFYQGKAIALKPEELGAMKQRWANAGADERFGLLEAFGRNLQGQSYLDTVGAVTGGGGTNEIVGRLARERPELAREILHGSALLNDKEAREKTAMIRPVLQGKLASNLYPDPAMQESVIQAALALDASRRAARGALYDNNDTSGLEQAIDDVAGKIVKRNGVSVAAPPGMSASRFADVLDNLGPGDLDRFGGAYDRNGKPFDARFIGDHAMLRQLAPGSSRYVVLLPSADGRGAPVMTASEMPAPLVIDIAAIGQAKPQQLTPYQRARGAARRGVADRIAADRDAAMEAP